jgi:coatomer protein complex subunit epsilon
MQGGEKYQQAFYVFEEMAQAPSTTAPLSLISQAIAEIHLGRYEEAEAALKQAMEKDPSNADAIANMIVLSILSGKDASSLVR